MKKKKIISVIMMLFAGIVWGLSFVVVKDSLDYITPAWQLALRLSIASVPALIFALINIKKFNKKVLIRSTILGVIFFLCLFSQNYGMNYTSASKSAFLTATYVAFVPIIEVVILRQKIKSKKVIAATVCLTGTALLTLQNGFIPQLGDLFLLLCGLGYAIHLLYVDYYMEENLILMHIGQIVVAAILSLIAALILEPFPTEQNTHCISGLLYCGIFEIFLGFFFQLIGQKNTSASLSGILLSLESVFAAFFAMIFLHEKMTKIMLAGSALIVIAAMINGLQVEEKFDNTEKKEKTNYQNDIDY